MDIDTIFDPVISDCLARLRSRNRKVDSRDVQTIFTPVFMAIAKATGNEARQRTLVRQWTGTTAPGQVTEDSLRTFVSRLVEAGQPPFDLEAMRRKQAALEAELAAPIRATERPNVEAESLLVH